ncbi:MAG TPA: HAD-IIA family hydrolase [Micromonosporaceae bacterium]|nr:HAD-IIA family hydrolase [Micromonosporaceae bacterium]
MTAAAVLADAYDLVVLDLDGVVYLVDRPVPGAVDAVAALRRRGRAVVFATNNASRRAAEVAALLAGMGVAAQPQEVLTSARATAETVARSHPGGTRVLVVGADALRAEVRDAGLVPVARADEGPRLVVQGYGAQVGWADLAEACVAVRAGAEWVATNADATLPSPRGPLPGNGALVAALRTALGRGPDLVVGKPAPGLFTAAARQAGAARPLVVGDRLDTDIAGARRAGMDSLLVLTGVSGPAELLAAAASHRPTYLATDLSGLFLVEDDSRVPVLPPGADRVAVAGWLARRAGRVVELAGAGRPVDALRAACALAWAGGPGTGDPAAGGAAPGGPAAGGLVERVVATSPDAEAALRGLGLSGAPPVAAPAR